MTILEHERVLAPDPAEQDEIGALNDALERAYVAHRQAMVAAQQIAQHVAAVTRIIGPDDVEVEIPASAFEALRAVVRDLARGHVVTIIPHERELTTKEAADILNVSRQFLVRLLDRGEIPFRRVGTHRRLSVEDVLAYREQRAARRQEKLDELARESRDAAGEYI